MNLNFRQLLQHAISSVINPKAEARWVMTRFDLPRAARWQLLILIVALSVIVAQLGLFIVPISPNTPFAAILNSPVLSTLVQSAVLVILVFLIYFVGRAMGGTGGFGNTILLVAWLQFIMACLQALQTIALILSPPLAAILGIIGFVIFFRLLTSFIAELHGFKSLVNVFLMVIVTMVGLTFGVSVILAMIGVSVPGAI